MRERPILFSGPMVQALRAGVKTQTRRALKPQPSGEFLSLLKRPIRSEQDPPVLRAWFSKGPYDQSSREITCPYGQPGDRLWVRETWMRFDRTPIIENGTKIVGHLPGGYGYRADMDDCEQVPVTEHGTTCWRTPKEPWRPSIHMPRAASRLTLELTEVRVERLQAISEDDAAAEGVKSDVFDQAAGYLDYSKPGCWFIDWPGFNPGDAARKSCRTLWEQINGAGSWDANPWVWCLSFRVIQGAA